MQDSTGQIVPFCDFFILGSIYRNSQEYIVKTNITMQSIKNKVRYNQLAMVYINVRFITIKQECWWQCIAFKMFMTLFITIYW